MDFNFKFKNEKGKEIDCELLLSYTNNDKNYLLFTDNTKDENSNLKVYVYYEDATTGDILPVEDTKELEEATKIYNIEVSEVKKWK